ncbi:MAG: hypothetical protein RLZZ245_1284 [Verrucomicrobiota bacterium]
MMLTVSAEAASTAINGHATTSGTFATNSNWLTAVQAEFGSSATVGTFEGIKLAFENNIPGLVTLLTQAGGSAMVTYGGNQTSDGNTRGYFLTYHGSTVPDGWLVHDKIGDVSTGNQVSLGSWYGNNRIIAKAVPEPSSVLVAGLLGLGALGRRRRN